MLFHSFSLLQRLEVTSGGHKNSNVTILGKQFHREHWHLVINENFSSVQRKSVWLKAGIKSPCNPRL